MVSLFALEFKYTNHKHQSYSKFRKLDAVEQKLWICHNPTY